MESQKIISFIRETFKQKEGFIPLHVPYFRGNEKKYVLDTIDSTFVSSVGAYVTRFEEMMKNITGAKYAIATVNGTTALHLALILAGVKNGTEVITQPLTFVATANAIVHAGGMPVFVDVDIDTLGLSPTALRQFLLEHTERDENGKCINKTSKRRIAACVPMHTFGFPAKIAEIAEICNEYGIPLVEDAAESLGSYTNGRHTGTFGLLGTFSFNGNKTVTCGGGGVIVTNDDSIGHKAKHISTTAKVQHSWEFYHDDIGYNYRLPNLNAALACAQLEELNHILTNKKELAALYKGFFRDSAIKFVDEPQATSANFWLNTIVFPDHESQQDFLRESNGHQVMTRPIWKLMSSLPMYQYCEKDSLTNSKWLEERVVNIPSSVRPKSK
ncbi:aminotransferase, LLPSF_NHT_00031 family [Chitinophaga terrae (ex Kim and Jung 2007)]|uniref:Aminotransferase, LLPSF_NHT_00031 family n=1 Tax=Chitinophaga terrae (ex Kim and Jung 2007) TaxID=408074 RepID=A0A1H3XX48_9BACT|nr:LegC family aminotransferase [Chitinophaga terrae (ex Kim and Jung 2007)]GEP89443.1 aminotransferase DegT [Chitinophaga terrae (ex Kim and Jung 2007)]SEA03820.1 aminotransferase, LLPSF_NHT_00031 family [Chitinophaga terrae (ex Kim and Jung 2007)]